MNTKYLFFIFLCFSALQQAHAQKSKKKEEPKCLHYGKVKDYSNAVDCGYLIESEEGKLLLPLSINAIDPSYRIGPDQIIKFDYKLLENTSSLCMVEALSAEITCLKLLPAYPNSCLDVDLPEGDWLKTLIEANKPHIVRKFMRDSDIVYLLDSPQEKAMYDCMGRLVCSWNKLEKNKCRQFPERSGKIIYQWEKIPD